jgi:hypothetical protein
VSGGSTAASKEVDQAAAPKAAPKAAAKPAAKKPATPTTK